MKIRARFATLGAVLVALAAALGVGLAAPPRASAMSWMLALPPLKPTPPATTGPRATVEAELDRTAPVTAWRPGQTFDSGAACEENRLAALKRFDEAVGAAGDGTPSPETMQRLTRLGETAYGRCVPAFASGADRGHAERD